MSIKNMERRLLKTAVDINRNSPEKSEVSYQHKVLAQTCLPYRKQDSVIWEQYNGDYALVIRSMEVVNPRKKVKVVPGLPYGSKARILLIYLHQQAIIQNSPLIDVEENMTRFLTQVHGRDLNGREIRAYKEQMTRLAACHITMAVSLSDEHVINRNATIIQEFDLWFSKNEQQKVIWSSKIRLSDEYFQTLKQHVVPLDHRAVRALSHSAMGLDIYTWLAGRLHRIPVRGKQFVSWQNLRGQFGEGYKRMDNFKRVFRQTLTQVLIQYPNAKENIIEEDNRGFWLKRCLPAVPYRKSKERQSDVN